MSDDPGGAGADEGGSRASGVSGRGGLSRRTLLLGAACAAGGLGAATYGVARRPRRPPTQRRLPSSPASPPGIGARELARAPSGDVGVRRRWFVDPAGSDAGAGLVDSPWSMAYALAGADGRIGPGDVVQVQDGRYRTVNGWKMTVGGSATEPVVFRAASGRVVLDGALPALVDTPATSWEPVAPDQRDTKLFRSTVTLDKRRLPYGGFLTIGGERYSLAAHKDSSFLAATLHDWQYGIPRYLGPGLATDESGVLYVRLEDSTPEAQCGRAVAKLTEHDPRLQPLWIGQANSFGIEVRASNIVLDGFEHIDSFYGCFLIEGDNVTVRRSGGDPLYFGIRIVGGSNIVVDSCRFEGRMPTESWWVSYADIKGGERPADHMRKLGIYLGGSTQVRITNSFLVQFFDAIIAAPACHDVEVDHCTFDNTWDDGWQMYGGLRNIDYHHNLCLGAGPSHDSGGTKTPAQAPGTVWIHHNVIDTTRYQVFWYRNGHPKGYGERESIAFSSHGKPTQAEWPVPWKVYANTVVASKRSATGYLGLAYFGGDLVNQYPDARHEVYNNILLVRGGLPLGRDFFSKTGREIYDGNVYFGWDGRTPIWRLITTSTGVEGEGQSTHGLRSIADLHATTALVDSKGYYAPGWEASGLEIDPRLDELYRPVEPLVRQGGVDLAGTGWPGTAGGATWRGAVEPPS